MREKQRKERRTLEANAREAAAAHRRGNLARLENCQDTNSAKLKPSYSVVELAGAPGEPAASL